MSEYRESGALHQLGNIGLSMTGAQQFLRGEPVLDREDRHRLLEFVLDQLDPVRKGGMILKGKKILEN